MFAITLLFAIMAGCYLPKIQRRKMVTVSIGRLFLIFYPLNVCSQCAQAGVNVLVSPVNLFNIFDLAFAFG
jgi:hypothetical protein